MKKQMTSVRRSSVAQPVPTKRFLSAARISAAGAATVYQISRKSPQGAKIRVLVSHPMKAAQETAARIRAIVAMPITQERNLKVARLVDKAKAAKLSEVTARFRKSAA